MNAGYLFAFLPVGRVNSYIHQPALEPDDVVTGKQPLRIVGSMAGG